jgi:hypothetical protein
MRAEDLRESPEGPGVWIKGKGGRERVAPIVGTPEEIRRALAYLAGLNGHNRIHSGADIHGYRAQYAQKVYTLYARPLAALKGKTLDYTALTGKRAKDGGRIRKSALYLCRGDEAGRVFDRAAMLAASRALGHDRESVVGEHYLYNQSN